jgi:hypothetical protein
LATLVTGTKLGPLWHVERGDTPLLVLGKVVYRLSEVFRSLPDRQARVAAPVIYNLRPDALLHDRLLKERHIVLRDRHPDDEYSDRTLSRHATRLGTVILHSLVERQAPIDDTALLAIVRSEVEFADQFDQHISPAAFAQQVRMRYSPATTEAEQAFLRLRVLAPVSTTDDLIVARTDADGDWLCVFSTEEGLRAHQRVTPGQPWSERWHTIRGDDLVRTVASRWTTVGVLVDPPATPSGDAHATLRLSSATVAHLADHC